jgi:hypothetical protein
VKQPEQGVRPVRLDQQFRDGIDGKRKPQDESASQLVLQICVARQDEFVCVENKGYRRLGRIHRHRRRLSARKSPNERVLIMSCDKSRQGSNNSNARTSLAAFIKMAPDPSPVLKRWTKPLRMAGEFCAQRSLPSAIRLIMLDSQNN